MSEQDTPLPCVLPCPKCGSSDVRRRWYDRGHTVQADGYGMCKNRFASGQCLYYTATREHLDHSCRCCGHRWQTAVLPKKRKAKGATPDTPDPEAGERVRDAWYGGETER